MVYSSASYSAKEAFDPAASVFVSANAGTGKTSLLTSRVLALLLHGIDPSKLLCLTYTHAAASEMSNRILEKLGHWVMAAEKSLASELLALTGQPATQRQVDFTRSLFAKVLEAPEGLRIQTIHSFCQSLLRRFPVEAGVSPHFTLMDSRTEQEFLQEARLRLFARAQGEDPKLQESLNTIAHMLSEASFHNLLAEIIKNKRRIRTLFTQDSAVTLAAGRVWELMNIPIGCTLDTLTEKHFAYDPEALDGLRAIAGILLQSKAKTDKETGGALARWLEDVRAGEAALDAYVRAYITDKGERRKKLCTKEALEDSSLQMLVEEQERVWRFLCERRALETARRTECILHVAEALLALYDKLKSNHALMDYDDLIMTARNLLQKPGIAPWVLYKLDGGIEHILVDEAQDTSPEQWDIVEALAGEFFSGLGSKEQDCSLFVVGDEKQSIYSFQGAAPMALGRKEQDFSARIRDVAKPLHTIQLNRSFRSTPEVLSAVDAVFAQGTARSGLMFGRDALEHVPTRTSHPGLVELWPLVEPLLEEGEVSVSSKTLLARRIAATIRGWLDDGVWLDSKGRCVAAGDIMILIRKRTSLVDCLVRALKRKDIPVAGHDRMALGDNLAVQDLIALGQCLLLPEDSLTLAALLKSPIFSITEERLFTLCHGREKKSLWERLREEADNYPEVREAYTLLSDLRAKADYITPYALYTYLLDTLGARRRFTGRMGEEYFDALDEFLGQALLYERGHTASLQGFLSWLAASDSEIKRDMEQAKGCVRIMTVHGAKGLQAPIVLLPDTVDVPRGRDALVWYEDRGTALPFWPAPKMRDAFTLGLQDQQKEEMFAEYRRLLYVALTRAEDRLYITGCRSQSSVSEESWYHLIQGGLASQAAPFETEGGHGLRIGKVPLAKGAKQAGLHQVRPQGIKDNHDFSFLHGPAPSEPVPSQPLAPSHLAVDEPASASPLAARNGDVFQRGNLIHRLLQHLPRLRGDERMPGARALAASYRHAVSEAVIEECIAEVLRVIDDPRYAFLFAENALAEVPVAGCVAAGDRTVAVAGQIDRLCIGPDEVWVVDYKSNRMPPADNSTIPVAYGRQMALYHRLMRQIYPDRAIRCALLWTADASITLLDEPLLNSYI